MKNNVNNECIRCGKCCRHHRTLFLEANAANPLLSAMRSFLKREPIAEDADCLMLGWDNGKAICIIEKIFGYDAKPDMCKAYPDDVNGICDRLKNDGVKKC